MTTSRKKSRRPTGAKRLFRLLLFLFLLHSLVTFFTTSDLTVLVFLRQRFVETFWPPPGWMGEALPVHQQVVYTVLSTLWALPFWKPLWGLCGVPMLPLMLAVLCYGKLAERLQERGYVSPRWEYRNASFPLSAPRPSPLQQLRMARRLRRLKRKTAYQVDALCDRLHRGCLAEVCDYSYSGTLHLFQDLTATPHWYFGDDLGRDISPVLRRLSLSRDMQGGIGLYQNGSTFLRALSPNTLLWASVEDGQLIFHTEPPCPLLPDCIQIQLSRETA